MELEIMRNDGSAAFIHEELDGDDIVHVIGEIDIAVSGELASEIDRFLNSQSVVVDLSGCTYLDSTCLNVLVRAKKALNDRLHVVVPQTAKIHRIFQVSGLEGPLNVVNSLDA